MRRLHPNSQLRANVSGLTDLILTKPNWALVALIGLGVVAIANTMLFLRQRRLSA